jgi:hypothetical protein
LDKKCKITRFVGPHVGRGIVKYAPKTICLVVRKMIRRLVLDVLKPHKPTVVEVSEALSHLEGVEGVNIIINEIDQQVENAKVIVAGISISFDDIKKKLEEFGATIHSIDEVAAGKMIVEEVTTPQDQSARM